MKAFLKNYRQSPRKVRLVTDLIKGKSVSDAQMQLSLLAKRAAEPIMKLLKSAISNAKENSKIESESLYVKDARVDEGRKLKRFRPRAMGRSARIYKRSSHITLDLGENKKEEVNEEKK